MKKLTLHFFDKSGAEVARVSMESSRMDDDVFPEISGPMAGKLEMPDRSWDLETLGCLFTTQYLALGWTMTREWEGRWIIEPEPPPPDNL